MIHADTAYIDIELTAEQIEEVVSMHLQDLLSCYEESLEEKHDITFSMDSKKNAKMLKKRIKAIKLLLEDKLAV